jgi:hypothetical protein
VYLPLLNGKYRKPAKKAAALLCSLALASLLLGVYLSIKYDATRPLQPDASTGRIYRLDSRGHIVYLDKTEDSAFTKLQVIFYISMGLGLLTQVLFVSGFSRRINPFEKNQM